MASRSVAPPKVRIVLSATALLSFVSIWKAAALALAELGVAALFVTGLVQAVVGPVAVWFVAAACLLGVLVRAVDIESWGLFVPGGFAGCVAQAFGSRGAGVAAAVVLVERLLLAALACALIGDYVAHAVVLLLTAWHPGTHVALREPATAIAVLLVGILWLRARIGRHMAHDTIARAVWTGVALLLAVTAWAGVDALKLGAVLPLAQPAWGTATAGAGPSRILAGALGLALALPVVVGGGRLAQAALEFPPPRIRALRHTALLVVLFSLVAVAIPAFLFNRIVSAEERSLWLDAPALALAHGLAAPPWARDLAVAAVALTALLLLMPAARAALTDAGQAILRLATERVLPAALAFPHVRFGTPARAIDVTAAATVLVMVAGAGRVAWLGRAYAFALACSVLLKAVTLLRLRRTAPASRPFKVAFNLRLRGREVPLGLSAAGLLALGCLGALLAAREVPSLAAAGLLLGLVAWFSAEPRRVRAESAEDLDAFELLASAELSLDQVDVRPGCLLVAARNPYALAHLEAAFRAAGDRDVVVMTAGLLGLDSDDDSLRRMDPTAGERRLFSRVVALAEQHAHPCAC
jgi:hypothetical protein